MQKFCHRRKNVKYTDSYDVTDLSTFCVQLLFRFYYSIGSSVDYQALYCFANLLSMLYL